MLTKGCSSPREVSETVSETGRQKQGKAQVALRFHPSYRFRQHFMISISKRTQNDDEHNFVSRKLMLKVNVKDGFFSNGAGMVWSYSKQMVYM